MFLAARRRMALTPKQIEDLREAIERRIAALLDELDDLSELRALEAARARLAEGSYGLCVDCGGDIDYERLRVNPAALRDIRCQTRHEKLYGTAPVSSL